MDPEQLLGISSAHMRFLRIRLILCRERTVRTMKLSCSESGGVGINSSTAGTRLQCTGKLNIHVTLIRTCRSNPWAMPLGLPLHKTLHIYASDSINSGLNCPSQSICPAPLVPFTHQGGCQNQADYYTRKSSHLTCRSMALLTDGSRI